MAGPNRSSLIAKMYKVLKQQYKPILIDGQRPLLEHMLYACCLENAPYEKAEKVYQHLNSSFFDWNEVRVSTVKELAEAMRELPDPTAAAANLKCILQNVFETTYSFDLETVKKQNIGVGIKRLAKLEGASPFVVAYTTQHALGGHSIPLDRGALDVLYVIGIASEAERKSASVGGLERAIPKNKGREFGSLLHQLAADYVANPFSSTVKNLLLGINPQARERFPKRGQKKDIGEPLAVPNSNKPDGKPSGAKQVGKPVINKGTLDKSNREVSSHLDKSKRDGTKDVKKAGAAGSAAADAATRRGATKSQSPAKSAAKAGRSERGALARHGASHKSATKHLSKRKPR